MGQPIRNIPKVQVNNVGIYQIPNWQIQQPFVPNFNPVTNHIGFPIVDMPGCVNMHKDNRRDGKPWDRDLVNQDPKGSTTLCPHGEYPTYNAMDYEPEQLTIIREQEAPPVSAPPPPPESPDTPDTKDTAPKDPPCPGPNALRIGDIATNQKEKVSGHELRVNPQNPGGAKICVTLYTDIPPVEQYLPSTQVAATTAVIGVTAATSALFAKPLADLILRVVKPAVKKVISKIQTSVGKTPDRPSRDLVRANAYRQKKGLPPLKLR